MGTVQEVSSLAWVRPVRGGRTVGRNFRDFGSRPESATHVGSLGSATTPSIAGVANEVGGEVTVSGGMPLRRHVGKPFRE
jgi:hypothetical protein